MKIRGLEWESWESLYAVGYLLALFGLISIVVFTLVLVVQPEWWISNGGLFGILGQTGTFVLLAFQLLGILALVWVLWSWRQIWIERKRIQQRVLSEFSALQLRNGGTLLSDDEKAGLRWARSVDLLPPPEREVRDAEEIERSMLSHLRDLQRIAATNLMDDNERAGMRWAQSVKMPGFPLGTDL